LSREYGDRSGLGKPFKDATPFPTPIGLAYALIFGVTDFQCLSFESPAVAEQPLRQLFFYAARNHRGDGNSGRVTPSPLYCWQLRSEILTPIPDSSPEFAARQK
jgi:hypothetical protein